jgi:serine/threonine protein kinase
MEFYDPDSTAGSEYPSGPSAANHHQSATKAERMGDRFVGVLERWQEQYLHDADTSLESLGIEDPSLRESLIERIDLLKPLYQFLRLSSLSTEDEKADFKAPSSIDDACNNDGGVGIQPVRSFGRYLVVEMLGEGTQGQVFRVVHPGLGKEYVLKLARRSLALDPGGRERLLREGRLLADCGHPNLVRVVDINFHNGCPYVVMELVRGPNLQQYAKERRPSPRQAARIVAELARAVAYIHGRGVVHLDIKPSNILIDEGDHARLIDFGLARMRNAWRDEAGESIGGTISYMSPEQALGLTEKIGPWTDVFGLGGLLYYLMTNRPVYQSTSRFGVLKQASEGDQIRPRSVNPRVPLSLERICRKALARDTDQRYRAAEELERALRRFLGRPFGVAAGAAVLGVAALGFAAIQTRPYRMAPSVIPPAVPLSIDSPAPHDVAPRIVSFEVKHFRGDKPPLSLGTIGVSPGPMLFDDDVRVHARLDAPAYCFLIAFNPDGKVQLCHPSEETKAPPPSDEIVYPAGDLYFPLTDGTGLQAFLLLASREPLPPFDKWDARRRLHWGTFRSNDSAVWSFDGHVFEPLANERRGDPRKHSGEPQAFKQVCDYIATLPGVAVTAVAFPVDPKE